MLKKNSTIRLFVVLIAVVIGAALTPGANADLPQCGNFQSVSAGGDCGGALGQTVYYDNGSVFECPASGGGWAASSASCMGFPDPWTDGCPGSGPQNCSDSASQNNPQPQQQQGPAPGTPGSCQSSYGNFTGWSKQELINQCVASAGVQNAGLCSSPSFNQIYCYERNGKRQ